MTFSFPVYELTLADIPAIVTEGVFLATHGLVTFTESFNYHMSHEFIILFKLKKSRVLPRIELGGLE